MSKFLPLLLLFLLSCGGGKTPHVVGILQWTEEIEAYRETYRGVLDGLEEGGFSEAKNLKIIYINAEQKRERALKAVRTFLRQRADLIIALGTGSALAAMEETRKVPIIYSIVGDPEATGIKGPNVTGTSMKVPVRDQLKEALKFVPRVKRVGVLYCPKMPQAVATAKEAMEAARTLGLQAEEIAIPEEELSALGMRLSGKLPYVDLVYIPTDPILHRPDLFEKVFSICSSYQVPVVGVSEDVVKKGALLAYHCSFYEIGRQAAAQAVLILSGMEVKKIPPEGPHIRLLSLNLTTARALGLHIPRRLIQRADNLYQ